MITHVLVCCLVLAPAAAAGAQQQRVRFPADDLRRVAPDSASRAQAVVITGRGIETAQRDETGDVMLEPGTFLAVRTLGEERVVEDLIDPTDTVAIEPPATEPFRTLPFRYITPDAAAEGTWVLRPIYKAKWLRWDDGAFRGALFLALEDSARRGRSDSLQVPIRFQLISDAADRIEPEQLALRHTNLPLERIELSARRASDSLRVHVVPDFDIRGEDVWIPVEPTLVVETSPPQIQGWGIGTARVIVRVIGASSRVPTAAILVTSAGDLDTTTVALNSSGVGTTRIRSIGTGSATLRASAAGFGEAPATIEFEWPLLFFVASLVGGVFGGIASAVQGRRSGKTVGPKIRWGAAALKGLFAGVLAAVAWYALGVNLLELDLGVPRFNEAAVFAFAALAGFFGIPRLRRRA